MSAAFAAELLKLRRRRVLIGAAALAALVAVVSTLVAVLPADPGDPLEQAGGATQGWSELLGVTGLLVLVLAIADVATELSQGTFRTLVLRQPDRLRLVAGKLLALWCALLAFLAASLALSALAATAAAAAKGLDVGAWWTPDGLATGLGDLARILLSTSAYGLFGACLALVLRSAPLALGVGVAWAGPAEHITADGWRGATDWFPGLLLETIAGNEPLGARAVLLPALYLFLSAGAAALLLRRRDVVGG